MKVINCIALILVVIGALNWGMIGFFKINVIASIFRDATTGSRIVYAIIGLAGLWSISFFRWLCCCGTAKSYNDTCHTCDTHHHPKDRSNGGNTAH